MIHAYEIYQTVLTTVCLAVLIVCALGFILTKAVVPFTNAVRRELGRGKLNFIVCAFFTVCAVMYGGSKQKITFDGDKAKGEGLFDNGSVATNNTLKLRWTYEGIPSSAKVYIDKRDYGSTNEWSNIGQTTAGSLAFDYTTSVAATNYEYYVWWYYMPPAPVHTNGVWVGNAYRTKDGRGIITVNTAIIDNGVIIATPEKKGTNQ